MNQRADSWKKNLLAIAKKPLISQQSCFLSHTARDAATHDGIAKTESSEWLDRFSACFLCAVVRSTCARSIRASAPSASAGSARPARTKGVRAAASRARAPAGS